MLKLCLRQIDAWDEKTEQFVTLGGVEVELEHSLYTISIWEAKYKKPFANRDGLERKELLDYISSCMCMTPDVPPTAWLALTQGDVEKINAYMEDQACATSVHRIAQNGNGGKSETVTAELIYYYMTQFNIPFECEHWHLNRLLKLIDVAAVKNTPSKKMGKKEAAAYQAKLNAKRRAKR